MEIREQHNLIRLFAESFALLNRCGGALFVYFLVLAALMAVILLLRLSGVPSFLTKIILLLPSIYTGVVLLRILGAKAENTGETVSNSFSASVFPTIYFLIYNIALAAVLWLLGTLSVFFISSTPFLSRLQETLLTVISGTATASTLISGGTALLGMALPFLLIAAFLVRFLYGQAAIALREQGPVEALIYSWQLTSGKKYFTALGAGIISFLAVPVYSGVVGYALYTLIPLYFADSFNLAALTPAWWGVFGVLGIGYFLITLAVPAFLVLVFLNQDYGHNRGSFTPQAQLKLNSRETQVFGADNNVLPPGAGNVVRPEDVANVEVLKSSVSANAEDGVTQQHLQEVYQPKPEDLVQYSEEEDRMPTILFDDDMARQIEQERTLWENKQKQDKTQKGEDDAPTVKMSR